MHSSPAFGDPRLPSRFWAKVAISDGCWNWTALRDRDGYGRYWLAPFQRMAHRAAYAALVAPIAQELEIDHLCRNRGCVNPAHLEAVTRDENNRRIIRSIKQATASHCRNGHRYDAANTYVPPRGARNCRICQRAAVARYKARKAAEKAAS